MTFRNQRGFTFIELLIVVLIMSLLFGFGYTNYRDFARRKATENVVSELVGELRYTQQLANSVKKPKGGEGVGCDGKDMEKYFFMLNKNDAWIVAVCEGFTFTDKQIKFSDKPGISIEDEHGDSWVLIDFFILGKGSNPGGTVLVVSDLYGNSHTINISETGVIKSSL